MASNMGRPVTNRYKVPKDQWESWSNEAKRVFNEMYYSMRPSMQFAFIHPNWIACRKSYWETTRWNAAWEAAQIVDGRPPVKRVRAA